MITKTRAYIKNHPRFGWILSGVIFLVAFFIFLQYLYRSFAPPPGQTRAIDEFFLGSIVFVILILVLGGLAGVFWFIYHKTKEEFSA